MTTVEQHNFKVLAGRVDAEGRIDPGFARYLGKLTAQGIKYEPPQGGKDVTSIDVEQELDPSDNRAAVDAHGEEFTPVRIVHRAYIYEGDYYRLTTLFDDRHINVTVYGDDIANWPAAPSWFEAAAEQLRRKALWL